MSRLRYNGLRTTLGGSGLTSSATSVTFAAALTHSNGTNVPTITGSDYIPLVILDASGHESEIVWLTAYTAAATTGTISRGQEGTTGVSHSSGDTVIGTPTALDVTFVGCGAERTTNQSIAHASWTAVQFDATDLYDTDSIHDTVTNNSRFTVPAGKGGVWRFSATGDFATNGSGVRAFGFKKNGTQLANRYGFAYRSVSISYDTVETVMVDLLLAAGDYVEFIVYQESGSALNLVGAYMTCRFLG